MVNRVWVVQILAFAALTVNAAPNQRLANDQLREQTSFGADAVPGQTLVEKPAEISDGALHILRSNLSSGALHCIEEEGIVADRIPASWFMASQIHLDGPNELNLIVQLNDMPESPSPNRCLFGAHAVPFWVLRQTDGKFELLLNMNADAVKVLASRKNGYRDIRIWSITAVTRAALLFRFDGCQYRLAERKMTR